jgi:hypothetical protein
MQTLGEPETTIEQRHTEKVPPCRYPIYIYCVLLTGGGGSLFANNRDRGWTTETVGAVLAWPRPFDPSEGLSNEGPDVDISQVTIPLKRECLFNHAARAC